VTEEARVGPGSAGAGPTATRIRHDPPGYAGQQSRSPARWLVGVTGFLPSAEDERENEKLTLTFSTAPLEQDLEVTGPALLRFWARTRFQPLSPESLRTLADLRSLPGADLSRLAARAGENDVHWIVNLNDVFPEGRVRNLTSGWLAASHRRDPGRADWTQPGYDPFAYPEDREPSAPQDSELYEYVVEIWPTCNLFRAGHQIRIDIANSDVPHLLPTLVPSESEILHDPEHPSRLILPVVDPDTTDPSLWIEDPAAYFQGKVPWDAP
jgi:predicted acyl esterase